MENITANLATAIAGSSPGNKLGVLVTINGHPPPGFDLKEFEELDGLYYGKLDSAEIAALTWPKHKVVAGGISFTN